ncbi:MAG: HipA domain-containing protein [Lachnospiraceae bacterium]
MQIGELSSVLPDLSGCPVDRICDYGGSDRKIGVIADGRQYMLKFAHKNERGIDFSTSCVSPVFSEYIGSEIFRACGIPAHETHLVLYKGELAVACRNFCEEGDYDREFAWYMRTVYDASERGRIPRLPQIYNVMKTPELRPILDESVKRYWDTFVIDALIGNFDRHTGNWSYIYNRRTGKMRQAPVYDCGSSLFPGLDEAGMANVLAHPDALAERVLKFPLAALSVKQSRKVSYTDMLTSGFDRHCEQAVLRMYPRIDMEKIGSIVDGIPILSDVRRRFYKTILKVRYDFIIRDACRRAEEQRFDAEAVKRIEEGLPCPQSEIDRLARRIAESSDSV